MTVSPRSAFKRLAMGVAWAAAACAGGMLAHAEQQQVTGALRLAANARLDFQISIEKFVFLRVGDGAWPSPSSSQNTVNFALTGSIPSGAVPAVTGNNRAVGWSGAAPAFTVSSSNNVLPVEVRSNAGQVKLNASVGAPLTNGSAVIAMSAVSVSSSSAAIPAPVIPANGSGPTVNVTGGGASTINSLVTNQSANWTFSLDTSGAAAWQAGIYSGQITFTASVL